MLVNPSQPANARFPIEVTVAGIIDVLNPSINVLVAVSIMALQLSRLSYISLALSIIIVVNPVQP